MKFLKRGIAILILSNSFFNCGFTQKKAELGIYFSSWNKEHIALDFRQPVREKLQFVGGFSFGFDQDIDNFGVDEWTNELRTYRKRNTVERSVNLKIGATRDLKESPFYLGGNLLAGYQADNVYMYNSGSLFDPEFGWIGYGYTQRPTVEYSYGPFTSETIWAQQKWTRLGLQGVFGAIIPFGKRMTLNVFSALFGGIQLLIDEEILVQPENSNIEQFTPGFPFAILEINASAGVGVRYTL